MNKTTYIFVIRAAGTLSAGKVTTTSEFAARRYAAYQAVGKKGHLIECAPAKTQVRFK